MNVSLSAPQCLPLGSARLARNDRQHEVMEALVVVQKARKIVRRVNVMIKISTVRLVTIRWGNDGIFFN